DGRRRRRKAGRSDRRTVAGRAHLTNPHAPDRLDGRNAHALSGNEQAARAVLHLLRQRSRRTFGACVERQPLEQTDRILKSFDALPDGEANVARATFFTKVGLLPRAEEELRKLSDVADAVVAAESHGLRGRTQ